jgi:uncharacterized membrane protein YjjB (DUF3815 family)
VNKETFNTIIGATALALAVLQTLIALMGAVAAIVTAAFIIGMLAGVLIARYLSRGRGTQ